VHFIGRLERLREGVEESAAKSGTALDVPRLNVTDGADRADPRDILSEKLRRSLAKFYAEDFSPFGFAV
jgi:hypothetical protein